MCCEVKKELNSTLKLLEVLLKNTSLEEFFTSLKVFFKSIFYVKSFVKYSSFFEDVTF